LIFLNGGSLSRPERGVKILFFGGIRNKKDRRVFYNANGIHLVERNLERFGPYL
jgi:hypothetical protein